MEMQLRRQDKPPKPGPEVEVIRCEGGAGVRVQVVSDSIWGVWTHWDGHRSRECTGEDDNCIGHRSKWATRWKGYLHVWCPFRKAFCFLEITPMAAAEILRLLGGSPSMRGMHLRLDRVGGNKRAKIAVELTKGLGDVTILPEPLSPESVLRKLWGWKE